MASGAARACVRGYQPADRDAVNTVACAAFAQYARDYEDWPVFFAGIGRMADLSDDGDLLVAEQDGVIAGAVAHVGPGRPKSAIFPTEWSIIRMLVVSPAHRGLGVGRQLMAACLRLAQEAGAAAVGLHTSPIMVSALRMYEAVGFVRDCDLPPIRGVPYGRYVLPASGLAGARGKILGKIA